MVATRGSNAPPSSCGYVLADSLGAQLWDDFTGAMGDDLTYRYTLIRLVLIDQHLIDAQRSTCKLETFVNALSNVRSAPSAQISCFCR